MPFRLPPKTAAVSLGSALLLLAGLSLSRGHAQPSNDAAAGSLPKLPADAPRGYLPLTALPDSLALLPPPPAEGSAAFARDEEVSKAMRRTPGSPRWSAAVSDADLHFPHAISAFTCAAGFTPSMTTTPILLRLIEKSAIDVGLSTYKAKNKYQRIRPFVMHGNASCTPGDEKMLRGDGSYPSGHSALGWSWALLLAEIVPSRADAILQRGRDFGQSRLVCNVHWQSDVDAGRLMASATLARLHADPGFQADLATAKGEAQAITPSEAATCPAERAALQN